MAKGQRRSNRELKKPKKKKETGAASAASIKGISASLGKTPTKKS